MKKRKLEYSLAELIDKLTINQIKINKKKKNNNSVKSEINQISNDIEIIIRKKKIKLDVNTIRAIIIISQINLNIWNNKDIMENNVKNRKIYLKNLKIAHQLNGVRNQIKNYLMQVEKKNKKINLMTNIKTDNLKLELNFKHNAKRKK